MFPPLDSLLSRRVCQILVLAVALVHCTGLSRFFVICTGPHCESRIEFVHDSGACCDHSHVVVSSCAGDEHGERGDEDGCDGDHPEKHDRCGCTDVPLADDEGPPPDREASIAADSVEVARIEPAFGVVLSVHGQFELPPATGPPRIDRRTELLATTVLLI